MKISKVLSLSIIILIFTGFVFLNLFITTVGDELPKYNNEKIDKLEVSFYTPHKSPIFVIQDSENIDSIMNILNEILLIPDLRKSRSYDYNPLESYEILIFSSKDYYNMIKIYSNKYFAIDGKVYRIIRKNDVSRIYDIIISEPQDKEIDDFYYNIDKSVK